MSKTRSQPTCETCRWRIQFRVGFLPMSCCSIAGGNVPRSRRDSNKWFYAWVSQRRVLSDTSRPPQDVCEYYKDWQVDFVGFHKE